MKIELHILQNFAPSNLNRDDTGAPKDAEFGGVRRARISSQCFKRAIRNAFDVHGLVPKSDMAARTKRLVEQIAGVLETNQKRPREAAEDIVKAALEGVGFGVKERAESFKTQYLLFLPRRHVDAAAQVIDKGWSLLEALVPAKAAAESDVEPAEKGKAPKKEKREKSAKKEKSQAFPKEIGVELVDILSDASRSPDLALFGRMIADKPDWNVDAACQVAHAISTNRVTMDFDFFTAVDDFKPKDTAGSDMMGTIQFNSSCFYRYSVLDVAALNGILGGTAELTNKTIEAYLRASVLAIPTGKQNGMAAQNLPNYVLLVARESGSPVSLANAFLQPVRPTANTDLVGESIARIEGYFDQLSRMYGAGGVVLAAACADRDLGAAPAIAREKGIDALVQKALSSAGARA